MKRARVNPRAGGPVKMTRRRRLVVYGVTLGVWASGVLWLVFHNFLAHRGAFGLEANPLEPWWLKLHGAFAFAALWLFGLIWGAHVVGGWTSHRRRWSGGVLFGLFVLLIVSGYLLYYAGDDSLRAKVSLIHWIIGLGAPVLFLWHRLAPGRIKPVKA
ncbi:MAG: hypothetical protein P4L64_01775 [Caulobacteraceae bacterium]|nr:hypothetical protein [Caulobacteraceae bacterium]